MTYIVAITPPLYVEGLAQWTYFLSALSNPGNSGLLFSCKIFNVQSINEKEVILITFKVYTLTSVI